MKGNVVRVVLEEGVDQLVSEADQNTAFEVLEAAYEIQEREGRPMTLSEALAARQAWALQMVAQVAEQVEAIGEG